MAENKNKTLGGRCRSSYCSSNICDPGPRRASKSALRKGKNTDKKESDEKSDS